MQEVCQRGYLEGKKERLGEGLWQIFLCKIWLFQKIFVILQRFLRLQVLRDELQPQYTALVKARFPENIPYDCFIKRG